MSRGWRGVALGFGLFLLPTLSLAAPVPDFGPHLGVITHEQLGDVGAPLQSALSALLGEGHFVDTFVPDVDELERDAFSDPDGMLWMRDYQPIYVRAPSGALRAVRYLAKDAFRDHYLVGNDHEVFISVPYRGEPGLWMESRLMPIIHQNGNLVSTGEFVFITDDLFVWNRDDDVPDRLRKLGYRPRSEDEVRALLAAHLEVAEKNIIALPPLPDEETGHVDMFVMALGPRTVMIPEIRDRALPPLRKGPCPTDDGSSACNLAESDALRARTLQLFLDEQARTVRARGLTVRRLPMLPPRTTPAAWNDGATASVVFPSPANGILLSRAGRRLALVPSFRHPGASLKTRRLQRRYEREWVTFFDRLGWRAAAVDATELSGYLGLFRCVTAPVPDPTLVARDASRTRPRR